MGRRRINVDLDEPLPRGLYKDGRLFRARRPGGPWQYFGRDYLAALTAFKAWQAARAAPASIGQLLETCVGRVWPDRVRAGRLAPRTLRDYGKDAEMLTKGLGHIPIAALSARHVARYRDARAVSNPAHVRNELACLAAALSWAVEDGLVGANVCRDVRRPRRAVRGRLVSDAEYLNVYAQAPASVRLAMVLCVRTLGLPADVLAMGPRNVRRLDGRRTLAFARGKTGAKVEVEVVGELAAALEPLLGTLHATFVRRRDGKAYTVMGMGAMFRRCCRKAGVRDFGLRDLRAKGATDMFRAGAPIRQIQLLLGHASVRTTEVYLKGLLAEVVRPNELPIVAGVC